jgi:hypothetical protein
MVAAHTVRMSIARRLSIDNSEGLFVRVPAPDPPAALAGALPNTLEVERLHTVACEKVKQQLCLREGGAGGQKNQLQLRLQLFSRSRSPLKQAQSE